MTFINFLTKDSWGESLNNSMYLMVTLLFLKQKKNKAFNFCLIFYKVSIRLFKITLSNGTKDISQMKMFIPSKYIFQG